MRDDANDDGAGQPDPAEPSGSPSAEGRATARGRGSTRRRPTPKPAAKKTVSKKPVSKKPVSKKAALKKTVSKKEASKRAPVKQAATGKAVAKLPSSKKPAKKEAAAAEAPTPRKAPAKKAAAKRTAGQKTAAKKTAARKPTGRAAQTQPKATPARRSRVVRIDPDAEVVVTAQDADRAVEPEPAPPRAPLTPGRATPPSRRPSGDRRRWAICASVTEELLNDLVFFGLGEGVSLDPVEQQLTLPSLGEVTMRLSLVITGVRFELRGDDGGRARVTVSGQGVIGVITKDFEGDVFEGAPEIPAPPAPLPIALTALAEPFLELRDDRSVSAGLDLRNALLLQLGVDLEAGVPEGVDATAWAGILQMTATMFSMMGDRLFDDLGDAIGSVGMDLGEDIGTLLADLGVDHGPADTQVSSGVLSFGLPAQVEVEGRAMPVPVAGKRLGVSVARSGVNRIAADLFERAIGGLPLPFELDIDLGEQQVAGKLRQARIISDRFPDIRSAVRTEVGLRLVRGRLEIAVSAAWIELPSMVPKFVNSLSRRLGGLLSMAPLRFRFPATMELPIVPGTDDTVSVRVDDLRVSSEGVGVVVALA